MWVSLLLFIFSTKINVFWLKDSICNRRMLSTKNVVFQNFLYNCLSFFIFFDISIKKSNLSRASFKIVSWSIFLFLIKILFLFECVFVIFYFNLKFIYQNKLKEQVVYKFALLQFCSHDEIVQTFRRDHHW